MPMTISFARCAGSAPGDALRKILDRIRKRVPGIALRSSFIVGFPGETEEAFERLADFIREQEFDRVGVFTYSLEENTAAFDLPNQVPERVKRARRARLMELQGEISLKKNRDLIGREIEVLVEGPDPRTRHADARTQSVAGARNRWLDFSQRRCGARRVCAGSYRQGFDLRSEWTRHRPSCGRTQWRRWPIMPKKAATSSRAKFLNEVHEHLLETKARLLEEMETELKAQREGNKDEGMDAYDLASEERDREIKFHPLGSRARQDQGDRRRAGAASPTAVTASVNRVGWKSAKSASMRCRSRAYAATVSRTASARRNRSAITTARTAVIARSARPTATRKTCERRRPLPCGLNTASYQGAGTASGISVCMGRSFRKAA